MSPCRIAIWLAALVLAPAAAGGGQQVASRHYTADDGLAHNTVTRVFEDSRGYIWLATADGLTRFDGDRFVTFRAVDGPPAAMLTDIGEAHGTLWVTARDGTAVRLNDSWRGPRFFAQQIAARAADPRAPVVASVGAVLRRVFEHHSREDAPLVVRGTSAVVTDVLRDQGGHVWIATSGAGVFVVPPEPVVNYTARDELPDEHVVRVIESRDGRIYAVTRRGGVAELEDDGVEAVPGSLFAPFHTIGRRIAQDEQGVWWFRTSAGLFTAPGPALSFAHAQRATDAAAAPRIDTTPFVDSRGWLWEPLRGGGVTICRDRGTRYPGCLDYASADGIGHVVTSLAEDTFGRVYLGTSKGLLRFDAESGTFRGMPRGVRLAGSFVTDAMRDSRGRIWVATRTGVSVIVPRRPPPARVPAVYVTALTVDGKPLNVPPRGAAALDDLHVDGPAGELQIEYAAPGLDVEGLHYQHRLLPRDTDWSGPSANRTVAYTRLRGGTYRFAVRAVGRDGRSGAPAIVALRIRPSPWARWWWVFAAAAVLSIGGGLVRQLQRADGRRDLAGVPLRVFGGVEEQAEDGRRHRGAADGAWLGQR